MHCFHTLFNFTPSHELHVHIADTVCFVIQVNSGCRTLRREVLTSMWLLSASSIQQYSEHDTRNSITVKALCPRQFCE